jgi:hypothetical protein
LANDTPQVVDTAYPVDRREHLAAKLYAMPKAPSNIANEEFGALNSRYGK